LASQRLSNFFLMLHVEGEYYVVEQLRQALGKAS